MMTQGFPPSGGGFTARQTREILETLGHSPRKPLGQNFLVDANIVRKSLELAAIAPGDTVVEIGPGLGTLTAALLATGARVFAVERDAVLARHLRAWLAPLYPKTFHLLESDAVRHPLAGLPDAVAKAGAAAPDAADAANTDADAVSSAAAAAFPEFKIVANLPYAISTPWVDALLTFPAPLPVCMVVMLQRETAERLAAVPGTGGKSVSAITIALDSAFECALGHRVPPACFFPPPRVDSVLLHLVRKTPPRRLHPATRRVLRALFLHRRKQIGPLLRRLAQPDVRDAADALAPSSILPAAAATVAPVASSAFAETWLARLTEWGATPQSRPESIPLPAWLALDELLAKE